MNTSHVYFRDTDLAERYGTARATIWRWAAAGEFPQPVKLSPGCTRWRSADVEAFEAQREAARRAV